MEGVKIMRYRELYETLLQEHQQVFEAQDEAELEAFLQEVMAARRIFVTGAGLEGIAARSFAMSLKHLGKENHWLRDETTPGIK